MSNRAELARHVRTMSEAEVVTVLRFVQFLEGGHVRPRVGDSRDLMKQAKAIVEDLVEIVDVLEQPEVELVRLSPGGAPPPAGGAPALVEARPALCEGAIAIPPSEWAVTLDGFSHVFHDLECRLWVQPAEGEAYTLAAGVPLGQVYLDCQSSERLAVQVALNRAGSVYGDFRYIHRVVEPRAIYLRQGDGELSDLIVEGEDRLTVLEVSIPEHPAPGVRNLAFLGRRPTP